MANSGTSAVCTAIFISILCICYAFGDFVVVSTTSGDVQGYQFETSPSIGSPAFDHIYIFKGIPYAASTSGKLRLRPPQDPTPWEGIRNATRSGEKCAQRPSIYPMQPEAAPLYGEFLGHDNNSTSASEDCLNLNVYTHDVSVLANQPVMVWIHGGGFTSGTGSSYPGEVLAAHHNVVIVTINYRLGDFHSLQTLEEDAPANFGYLDQIKALQWVQANIRNFGGDPEKVTIFGESSGSQSVSLLVMSPLATGLFHRAISQSGVWILPGRQVGDVAATETIASAAGCVTTPYGDMMSCLRGKSAEDILAAGRPGFPLPVVDGHFLMDAPNNLVKKQQLNKVDYLLGTNNDEYGWMLSITRGLYADGMTAAEFQAGLPYYLFFVGLTYPKGNMSVLIPAVIQEYLGSVDKDDLFVVRDQFVQLKNDVGFVASTVLMAETQSAQSVRVYQYEFQHRSSIFPFKPDFVKAEHMDELFYVFGIPLLRQDAAWKLPFTDQERDLSLDIMAYWVNFANNGDPNDFSGAARIRDSADWPRYTPSSKAYMKLNLTSSADVELREKRMKFWNEVVPKLMGEEDITSAAVKVSWGFWGFPILLACFLCNI
ncbi:fatty acyl-CoA hydrolase precursor, medium chain-like [Branchiostoma lanceolatum]|uniref:fatty acyl-CoA hydrolase precursor, medium chain-like n=1 Tax=Branchiostoma lanceolatum TaxID=7740 RepID=UPI003455CA4D